MKHHKPRKIREISLSEDLRLLFHPAEEYKIFALDDERSCRSILHAMGKRANVDYRMERQMIREVCKVVAPESDERVLIIYKLQ